MSRCRVNGAKMWSQVATWITEIHSEIPMPCQRVAHCSHSVAYQQRRHLNDDGNGGRGKARRRDSVPHYATLSQCPIYASCRVRVASTLTDKRSKPWGQLVGRRQWGAKQRGRQLADDMDARLICISSLSLSLASSDAGSLPSLNSIFVFFFFDSFCFCFVFCFCLVCLALPAFYLFRVSCEFAHFCLFHCTALSSFVVRCFINFGNAKILLFNSRVSQNFRHVVSSSLWATSPLFDPLFNSYRFMGYINNFWLVFRFALCQSVLVYFFYAGVHDLLSQIETRDKKFLKTFASHVLC